MDRGDQRILRFRSRARKTVAGDPDSTTDVARSLIEDALAGDTPSPVVISWKQKGIVDEFVNPGAAKS